jgi:hypothetical protein
MVLTGGPGQSAAKRRGRVWQQFPSCGLGRPKKKREERKEGMASRPVGKLGQQAKNKEGRMKEKNSLFFLFSRVCKSFSNRTLNSNSTLTKTSHHINKYAAT